MTTGAGRGTTLPALAMLALVSCAETKRGAGGAGAPTGPAPAAAPSYCLRAVQPGPGTASAAPSGGGVELVLTAARPLPVRAALPVLYVGEASFALSRPGDGGAEEAARTLVFTLTAAEAAALVTGAPVRLRYGDAPGDPDELGFGAFDPRRACR